MVVTMLIIGLLLLGRCRLKWPAKSSQTTKPAQTLLFHSSPSSSCKSNSYIVCSGGQTATGQELIGSCMWQLVQSKHNISAQLLFQNGGLVPRVRTCRVLMGWLNLSALVSQSAGRNTHLIPVSTQRDLRWATRANCTRLHLTIWLLYSGDYCCKESH